MSYHLGKGNTINFWNDRWCGSTTLKSQFPELFSAVVRKAIRVSASFDSNGWNWVKILRGAPARRRRGRDQVRLLQETVRGSTPSSSEDDVIWRWHKTGIFSVKSTYGVITDGGGRELTTARCGACVCRPKSRSLSGWPLRIVFSRQITWKREGGPAITFVLCVVSTLSRSTTCS